MSNIDALEDELFVLATKWREAPDDSPEASKILNAYEAVLIRLFDIGGWCGEPDATSQLPDELMPQIYKDYWARRLKPT